MKFQRIHQSRSASTQTSSETSQFASRPFAIQTQPASSPTQKSSDNQAFQQHKLEATGLELKEKSGAIAPAEQERLGVLRAKMNDFWTQTIQESSQRGFNFGNVQVNATEAPNSGFVQRVSVKEHANAFDTTEKSARRANKFKHPTKQALDDFFKEQSEERKTNPNSLQQDETTEMLNQYLTEQLKVSQSTVQMTRLIGELKQIKKDYVSAKSDRYKEEIKGRLLQLLIVERAVRKHVKKELNNVIKDFQVKGGFEQFMEASGAFEANEANESDDENKFKITNEMREIVEAGNHLGELYGLLNELGVVRIETKITILGDDRQRISKKEDAKHQKLLKMKTSYRKDESKKVRIEGKDISPENETVPYLTAEEAEEYKIKAVTQGKETYYVDSEGKRVDSQNATQTQSSDPDSEEGLFIFVMSEDGDIYVADEGEKSKENEKFHHSSFLGGKPIAAAGEIKFSGGQLKEITNASGHYQPDLSYTYQALKEFRSQGMTLTGVNVRLLMMGKTTLKLEQKDGTEKTEEEDTLSKFNLDANDFMALCEKKGIDKPGEAKVTVDTFRTWLKELGINSKET